MGYGRQWDGGMTEKSNCVEYVLEDDVQKLPERPSDQEWKEHCTPHESRCINYGY